MATKTTKPEGISGRLSEFIDQVTARNYGTPLIGIEYSLRDDNALIVSDGPADDPMFIMSGTQLTVLLTTAKDLSLMTYMVTRHSGLVLVVYHG